MAFIKLCKDEYVVYVRSSACSEETSAFHEAKSDTLYNPVGWSYANAVKPLGLYSAVSLSIVQVEKRMPYKKIHYSHPFALEMKLVTLKP